MAKKFKLAGGEHHSKHMGRKRGRKRHGGKKAYKR